MLLVYHPHFNKWYIKMNYNDIIDNLLFSEIRSSDIHGDGLFSTHSINQGLVLGKLDGQKVPGSMHPDFLNALSEWNAIGEGELLVRHFRTKYSFINHSRNPNLVIKYFPIRVVALRSISVGEELTLDYRKEPLSDEYIREKGQYYL